MKTEQLFFFFLYPTGNKVIGQIHPPTDKWVQGDGCQEQAYLWDCSWWVHATGSNWVQEADVDKLEEEGSQDPCV